MIAPGRVAQSVEVSGLVLPTPVAALSLQGTQSAHTFGMGLGFPHLGERLPDLDPEMWKSWGQVENVVKDAAVRVMGWNGPQSVGQANRSGAPQKALQLSLIKRTLKSTQKQDEGRLLRPHIISGEVKKLTAIRDVSGTRLRYESAGASAAFTLSPSSVQWSRDPRQL
jgi:hypothetical protein